MLLSWMNRFVCPFLPFYADAAVGGGTAAADSSAAGVSDVEPRGEAEPSGDAGDGESGDEPPDLTIPDLLDNGSAESSDGAQGKNAPGTQQAKSVFDQLVEKEFGKPAAKPEELPPDVKPNSRAAQDIIGLRQRAQRAETEIQNYQQVMQQRDTEVSNYLGQVQTQMQQLATENARMRGQLEVITQRPQGQPQNADPANSYVDQLMNRFKSGVVDPQLQPMMQRLDQIAQENKQLRDEQTNRDRAMQTHSAAARIRQTATQTYMQTAMPGIPPEELTAPDPVLGDSLANMGTVLTLAMMRGAGLNGNNQADFQRGTELLRRYTLKAAGMIYKHQAGTTRKALEAQKKAPETVARSGVGGSEIKERIPGPYTLNGAGYQSPYEWIEAGRPKLKMDARDKE